MIARHGMTGLMAALIAGAVLAAGAAAAEFRTLEGSASYRERLAMPPGAVLEVELYDVSRQDAPAPLLSAIAIRAESVPVPFQLLYDPAMIDERYSYAVTAKLVVDGETVFRSTSVHPVLTRGAPDRVEILMEKMGQGVRAAGGMPSLVGATWLVEDIRGGGVIDFAQTSIGFDARGGVHGTGGCNQFNGTAEIAGEALSLGPLATTRRACAEALMDQESRFFAALDAVKGYRFDGPFLLFTDAAGDALMRLTRLE